MNDSHSRGSMVSGHLYRLKDGWLEGHGRAPKAEDLAWLEGELAKTFPEELETPGIVPTDEGNMVMEWVRPGARIEVEVNFDHKALELSASDLRSNQFVEETFGADEWKQAFARVTAILYGYDRRGRPSCFPEG